MVKYLTKLEATELVRAKSNTLTNMKAGGVFREGVQLFRRSGLGPCPKSDALIQ